MEFSDDDADKNNLNLFLFHLSYDVSQLFEKEATFIERLPIGKRTKVGVVTP